MPSSPVGTLPPWISPHVLPSPFTYRTSTRVPLSGNIDPPSLSSAPIFAKLGVRNVALASDTSGQMISPCWGPLPVVMGTGAVATVPTSPVFSPGLGDPDHERIHFPLFRSPSVTRLARNSNIASLFSLSPLCRGAFFLMGIFEDYAIGGSWGDPTRKIL